MASWSCSFAVSPGLTLYCYIIPPYIRSVGYWYSLSQSHCIHYTCNVTKVSAQYINPKSWFRMQLHFSWVRPHMEIRHKVGSDFRSNKRIAVAFNAVNLHSLGSVLTHVTECDVMLRWRVCGKHKLLNTIAVLSPHIALICHLPAGLERTDV